jgi:hypothetical protein
MYVCRFRTNRVNVNGKDIGTSIIAFAEDGIDRSRFGFILVSIFVAVPRLKPMTKPTAPKIQQLL